MTYTRNRFKLGAWQRWERQRHRLLFPRARRRYSFALATVATLLRRSAFGLEERHYSRVAAKAGGDLQPGLELFVAGLRLR
jgi:hypothetical protein